jgi:thiamine pyrophosphate-dependent acetolactate synthase large subunit-like protein
MGHSIPAALGASLALNRPVTAFVGDAAFLMGSAELRTASEYGAALKVIVLNDGGHGMVEKGVAEHCPELDQHYRFKRRVDAAGAAMALGVPSCHAGTADEFEQAVLALLTAPGPALIDAAIDPRPMPPISARTDMLTKVTQAGKGT